MLQLTMDEVETRPLDAEQHPDSADSETVTPSSGIELQDDGEFGTLDSSIPGLFSGMEFVSSLSYTEKLSFNNSAVPVFFPRTLHKTKPLLDTCNKVERKFPDRCSPDVDARDIDDVRHSKPHKKKRKSAEVEVFHKIKTENGSKLSDTEARKPSSDIEKKQLMKSNRYEKSGEVSSKRLVDYESACESDTSEQHARPVEKSKRKHTRQREASKMSRKRRYSCSPAHSPVKGTKSPTGKPSKEYWIERTDSKKSSRRDKYSEPGVRTSSSVSDMGRREDQSNRSSKENHVRDYVSSNRRSNSIDGGRSDPPVEFSSTKEKSKRIPSRKLKDEDASRPSDDRRKMETFHAHRSPRNGKDRTSFRNGKGDKDEISKRSDSRHGKLSRVENNSQKSVEKENPRHESHRESQSIEKNHSKVELKTSKKDVSSRSRPSTTPDNKRSGANRSRDISPDQSRDSKWFKSRDYEKHNERLRKSKSRDRSQYRSRGRSCDRSGSKSTPTVKRVLISRSQERKRSKHPVEKRTPETVEKKSRDRLRTASKRRDRTPETVEKKSRDRLRTASKRRDRTPETVEIKSRDHLRSASNRRDRTPETLEKKSRDRLRTASKRRDRTPETLEKKSRDRLRTASKRRDRSPVLIPSPERRKARNISSDEKSQEKLRKKKKDSSRGGETVDVTSAYANPTDPAYGIQYPRELPRPGLPNPRYD